MKVLFAVNDENISASIVKKYQKEYKEIISYKNVYYFNAILKELQRNKSYDRVVISEDLEEFTSSSLEQKDKFIFDKLDSISDEAVNSEGKDIPVILICSERRNKSEDILIKLFGIGIYNAIIGEDRGIDEVCRLISKPRSKKEAKLYYQIIAEDVNYQREKESDVKEEEIQNILMHFKKLGKNEAKYVESFNSIASQYNTEQLKVIIAVLPSNVKAVLKELSPEYQKIVFPTGRDEKGRVIYNSRREEKVNNGRLLDVEAQEKILKPIVVPTTMEKNMYKKVNPKKEVEIEELEEDDELEDLQEVEFDDKPKKRGRPKKNSVVEENAETLQENKPKKRGRPKKNPVIEETDDASVLPGFEEDDNNDDSDVLSGFEDGNENLLDSLQDPNDFNDYADDENEDEDDQTIDTSVYDNNYYNQTNNYDDMENISIERYDNEFDEEFDSLLTGDKKITTFVGTSKNGTSFIVNNIAEILSEMGINTAILDTTKNRNSYYIYTKNDENLRKTSIHSINNLIKGEAKGVTVNNNLTVYTSLPNQYEQINNSRSILETLVKNHSLILIDCDFDTPVEYFEKSQEMYLVQSMDVLTIQALTEFLRDLKVKGALDENKIRIVLNKVLRVRGVTGKNIIGGMSNYNDPEMSFMTELFNRDTVKIAATIPFDEDVYARYLESLIECEIRLNGYPKEFKQRLNELAGVVYPLLSNSSNNKKSKKEAKNRYTSSFTPNMNDTLDNMRKRY